MLLPKKLSVSYRQPNTSLVYMCDPDVVRLEERDVELFLERETQPCNYMFYQTLLPLNPQAGQDTMCCPDPQGCLFPLLST